MDTMLTICGHNALHSCECFMVEFMYSVGAIHVVCQFERTVVCIWHAYLFIIQQLLSLDQRCYTLHENVGASMILYVHTTSQWAAIFLTEKKI